MYYSFKIGRKDTIIILIDNTLSVTLQQIKYFIKPFLKISVKRQT